MKRESRRREARSMYRGAVIGAIVSKLLDVTFSRSPDTLLDLVVRVILFFVLAYLAADMLAPFLDRVTEFLEAEPVPYIWEKIRQISSR